MERKEENQKDLERGQESQAIGREEGARGGGRWRRGNRGSTRRWSDEEPREGQEIRREEQVQEPPVSSGCVCMCGRLCISKNIRKASVCLYLCPDVSA